jgi:FKBP-type peptidyl-prolyl cis-trans isomerase
MKNTIIVSVCVAVAFAAANCKRVKLDTLDQKVSYAIGYSIGKGASQQNPPINVGDVSKGITDGLAGTQNAEMMKEKGYAAGIQISKSLPAKDLAIDMKAMTAGLEIGASKDKEKGQMTEEEIRKVIQDFQLKMGMKNAETGKKYLEENKKKPGVVETKSGLQYRVLRAGNGRRPTTASKVKVNYKGQLINGEEFDSSYKRNAPAEFPVTGVIKGWTEALLLMQVGAKYELVIPSELGYGMNGNQRIPPSSTLIFEVELLEVK